VSVDTIEHLGPKERLELVSELARVTASHGFVAVGAPCGAAAREAEARLASEFREKTGREHPRLGEHLAQPEMSADELEQLVAAAAGPRFGRYKLSVVANMGVTAWYRLQRLTDLGRPLPWVTHAHRLIFQPSFPLYAGRLNAEPTYRRIIFVSAEA
jgi:nucleoid-associated protein YgaU